MTSSLDGHDLDLTFPCTWAYQVLGRDEDSLRAAIGGAVGALEHAIRFSNRSAGGKYISLEVEVVVPCDEQRLGIHQALHTHPAVVYVL